MNQHYADILALSKDPPLWWDECAVPRYCPFSPDKLANIYTNQCCLLLTACQGCGYLFKRAISRELYDKHYLRGDIEAKNLQVGDPPNIDCCPPGPSTTSEILKVLEYWERNASTNQTWKRFPELEVVNPDGWDREPLFEKCDP